MDSSDIHQQLLVALEDLDQSKVQVQELQGNLKDDENFNQSLKDQLNNSKEKRKEICER